MPAAAVASRCGLGEAVAFAPERPSWRDSLGLAIATLLLALVLAQRALHGLDAHHFIAQLRDHTSQIYSHRLFLPLMHGWHRVLTRLGSSPFASLQLASAVGTAWWTLAVHRASVHLGCDRRTAVMVAALAATTPGVVFFATVVEIHGVFLAFAGSAFWGWAHAVRAPRGSRFALLGVLTALAAGVHTSGHFLLWLLPALTFGLHRHNATVARGADSEPWPTAPAWRLWLATLAAHATTTLIVASMCPTPHGFPESLTDVGQNVRTVLTYLEPRLAAPWRETLLLLWNEWLQPFCPLSYLALAGLAARARWLAVGVLAGILPLVALVWALLTSDASERGAYLLPFACSGALLACAWLPRWAQAAALVLSLALAIGQVLAHDRHVDDPKLAPGVRAIVQDQPAFLLCGTFLEFEQVLRELPAASAWPLPWLAHTLPAGYAATTAAFDAIVDPPLAAGRTVLITDGALALLRGLPLPTVQRFATEHLVQSYQLTALHARGFAGCALTRKGR